MRDWNKEKRCFGVLCPNWKKRWKLNTDCMDSIELLSPRRTRNTVNMIGTLKCFNERVWRQTVLCLTWWFLCYTGIHDTSPSFFRWGTVLLVMLLQIFHLLPSLLCISLLKSKQMISKWVMRTHSKSKQLENLVWDPLRGRKSNEICLVDLFDRIYCFN